MGRSTGRSTGRSLFLALALLPLIAGQACAFEIYAIGTSATNCRGVERDRIFTVKLQEILRKDGFDATVVNGGIDGDRPVWMFKRLPAALKADTRLVIFEPGPNDPDKAYAADYAEKTLALLRDRNMPTIYVSGGVFETREQASARAQKYGAVYYGSFAQGVPVDHAHWQYDNEKQFGGSGKGPGGHMTAEGCLMVAQGMAPLVEKTLVEKIGIKPAR